MIAVAEKKSVPLGRLVATPAALEALTQAGQSYVEFVDRHRRGDWGEVGGDDWELNDRSLEDGSRVLSAYRTRNDVRIWVVTEADRSSTCILLPGEY
jgi:hypothetical protein